MTSFLQAALKESSTLDHGLIWLVVLARTRGESLLQEFRLTTVSQRSTESRDCSAISDGPSMDVPMLVEWLVPVRGTDRSSVMMPLERVVL